MKIISFAATILIFLHTQAFSQAPGSERRYPAIIGMKGQVFPSWIPSRTKMDIFGLKTSMSMRIVNTTLKYMLPAK